MPDPVSSSSPPGWRRLPCPTDPLALANGSHGRQRETETETETEREEERQRRGTETEKGLLTDTAG